jgi:hypothetical protein
MATSRLCFDEVFRSLGWNIPEDPPEFLCYDSPTHRISAERNVQQSPQPFEVAKVSMVLEAFKDEKNYCCMDIEVVPHRRLTVCFPVGSGVEERAHYCHYLQRLQVLYFLTRASILGTSREYVRSFQHPWMLMQAQLMYGHQDLTKAFGWVHLGSGIICISKEIKASDKFFLLHGMGSFTQSDIFAVVKDFLRRIMVTDTGLLVKELQ